MRSKLSRFDRSTHARVMVAGMVLALLLPAARGEAQTLFSDDFGDGSTSGWTDLWDDPLEETGGVMRNGSGGNADAHYSIDAGAAWTDYTYSIEHYADDDDISGFTFRIQNSSNYYRVTQGFGDNDGWWLRLSKVVSGSATDLASAIDNQGGAAGQVNSETTWYTFKIELSGTNIKVYIDDVIKFDINDSTYSTGTAGVWLSGQTEYSRFDNALVTDGGGGGGVGGTYQMATGTYTGNGADDRGITGVGFQPDVVLVKKDTTERTQVRLSTMTGDITRMFSGSTGASPDRIQSIDSDGFTIGTHTTVNANGVDYQWIAFQGEAGRLQVDSYTGNGSDNRSITGVGFQPDYVFVVSEGADQVYQRFSTMSGDESVKFNGSAPQTDRIQAFEADGFQVGTTSQVNSNGGTYHYAAWKATAGEMAVGTYTGNGSDDRDITGVGHQPDWMLIKATSGDFAVHRPNTLSGDTTQYFKNLSNISNGIQSLDSDGFQLGTHSTVNTNGTTYHWASFGGAPGGGGGVGGTYQMATGTLTGDGNDDRAVTGVGFQPDFVVIKQDGSLEGVGRLSSMSGDVTKKMSGSSSPSTDNIQSLDSDGFTLGTDDNVNGNGSTYRWIALQGEAGKMWVGSYTGDGSDNRSITGVGFQPDYVVILPETGTYTTQRFSTMSGDESVRFNSTAPQTNRIQAFEADGFQVGSASEVNGNGTTYHYAAFKTLAGRMDVGSYTGNASDDRDIVGVGFQPDWLVVKGDSTDHGVHRAETISGDVTQYFRGSSNFANGIQSLAADGFQLGTDVKVNDSGTTYHWAAFGDGVGGGAGGGSNGGVTWRPDAVDISPATTGSWQTIDLSAFVPVGTTGVFVEFDNTGSATHEACVRGTEDTRNYMSNTAYNAMLQARSHFQAVKVDSNREIEGWLSDAAVTIWLRGYTTGGDPSWFAVPSDVTPSAGSWQTIDVSGSVDTGADGVILFVTSQSSTARTYAIREVGGSDQQSRPYGLEQYGSTMYMVGLDAAKQFEANIETTSVKIYLVAQTKGSVVYYTDDTVLPDAALATWVTRDADDHSVPSEANGLLFYSYNTSQTNRRNSTFLHGDSSDTYTGNLGLENAIHAITGINGANEWLQWQEANSIDVNIAGYTTAYVLNDHEVGQEADAFTDAGSETNAELFGFKLDSGSDTISVTQLVFSLSNITGLSDGDWAGVEIAVDDNNDGTIGGGETTTVGGSGTVNQGAGTITFSTSFNVSAVTNYILRADFASLSTSDTVTINLTAANITASAAITGTTTTTIHTESGGAPALGNQSFHYLDPPVEVTPGTPNSWQTVDVSSQVPSGATGVIMRWDNNNNSDYAIGLRKPGSSDSFTELIYPQAHLWAMAGVDSNRHVEAYVGHVTDVDLFITGYTTDGVTFFTNAHDKSLGSTGTWTDIDISGDTGVDTAVGVIIDVKGAYQQNFGLRMNGSSDEIYQAGRHSWAIIGVDGLEVFEGKIASTDVDFYVVGYVTEGATFFVNAIDKSLSSTGAWTDIDISGDTGTNTAGGAFIQVIQTAGPDVTHGFRKNGTSQDMIGRAGSTDSSNMWALIEVDNSETLEATITSTNDDFYMVGYSHGVGGSWIASGSYSGTGIASTAITGVGFQPGLVIVKRYPNIKGEACTSTMAAGLSKQIQSVNGLWSNRIESLDADGFTVGTDQAVNTNGDPYYWIALKEISGLSKFGSYTGDGGDDRSITGLGFLPDYVMIFPDGAYNSVHRMSSIAGDATLRFDAAGLSTNMIQAFEADGFQVGTDGSVNANGVTYHYAAFKAAADTVAVGTYAGDAADNRDINTGFAPDWVIVDSDSTVTVGDGSPGSIQRFGSISGDRSLNFSWAYSTTVFDNCIQGFTITGFQVGNDTVVNGNVVNYHWIAFKDTLPSVSTKPSIVRWYEVDPYP